MPYQVVHSLNGAGLCFGYLCRKEEYFGRLSNGPCNKFLLSVLIFGHNTSPVISLRSPTARPNTPLPSLSKAIHIHTWGFLILDSCAIHLPLMLLFDVHWDLLKNSTLFLISLPNSTLHVSKT